MEIKSSEKLGKKSKSSKLSGGMHNPMLFASPSEFSMAIYARVKEKLIKLQFKAALRRVVSGVGLGLHAEGSRSLDDRRCLQLEVRCRVEKFPCSSVIKAVLKTAECFVVVLLMLLSSQQVVSLGLVEVATKLLEDPTELQLVNKRGTVLCFKLTCKLVLSAYTLKNLISQDETPITRNAVQKCEYNPIIDDGLAAYLEAPGQWTAYLEASGQWTVFGGTFA
nr:hypothetical protein Iba_chr02fCG8760 [Ipomoea batatas]